MEKKKTEKDVIAYRKACKPDGRENAYLWDNWDSETSTTLMLSSL